MIPLIHNYCDSWCDRCNLTSQCAVYAKTSKLPEASKNINNPEFWEVMADSLTEASALIKAKMKEFGIPPMTEQEEAEFEARRKLTKSKVSEDPLLKLSKEYGSSIENFLSAVLRQEILDRAKENISLGLNDETDKKLQLLNECNEVIQWYRYFIQTKLYRALSGFFDRDEDETGEYAMHDVNGSAKIAIISTERSIAAWKILFDLLPAHEDEILNTMMLLQKIIDLTKRRFPDAIRFVRPGFDE